MKNISQTKNPDARYAFSDVYCPKCYPECGFVDGGLIYEGDVVEYHHEKCGYTWIVKVEFLSYLVEQNECSHPS